MTEPVELAARVEIDADQAKTWSTIVDWDSHGEWVPFTTVRTVSGVSTGIGARFDAWTGIGRVGFWDPMEVTQWQPPHHCEIRKLGRVVQGRARFELRDLGADRTELRWTEWIEPPLGSFGRIALVAVRPLLIGAFTAALRRFNRYIQTL
jgi:uncharacterized protein YndB with AHSA1/START domain